ncbi:hypothetical protein GCM10009727_78350 [Actinomadura napierensis]|uniref:MFS transporter n=1 Tax=Actinomadura napierensis TaxID=267854 RepID=A0ABN3AEA4_9ACTN
MPPSPDTPHSPGVPSPAAASAGVSGEVVLGRRLTWFLAVTCGVTVANIYFPQALIPLIARSWAAARARGWGGRLRPVRVDGGVLSGGVACGGGGGRGGPARPAWPRGRPRPTARRVACPAVRAGRCGRRAGTVTGEAEEPPEARRDARR